MEKIVSLFQRNYHGDRLVRDEVVPGAEWVLAGEGVATQKYDGTCCRIKEGKVYKRYDAKAGKAPPPGFEAAQDPDPITGHWPGWVPVGSGPEDKWHLEAWGHLSSSEIKDGTYELCGPKIQGNPEGFERHQLVPHGYSVLPAFPRTFEAIKAVFADCDIEGVVWHHKDGRMVKIKVKDFGFKRTKK